MHTKDLLQKLSESNEQLCVTISLNTHRKHPDNMKDTIKLKNAISEVKKRLADTVDKDKVSKIVEALAEVEKDIDVNYNKESLHIFVSESESEFYRSSWETNQEGVHISNYFAVRPLVKEISRETSYLIMLLSQSGVHLYRAQNEYILEEVTNEDFPLPENPFYANADRASDSKHVDNLLREFLNRVDKALVKVANEEGLKTVVVCTEDNYSNLMQVADQSSVYIGHVPVDYNNSDQHILAKQGWTLVLRQMEREEQAQFDELEEAVGQSLVLTDLQEIYQACLDGRGDLLVIQDDFLQPVKLEGERELTLAPESAGVGVVDDISSLLASHVFDKGGRCVFVKEIPNESLRPIALKVRY